VLHSLASDGLLGAQYRLNGVVTLVDAVNGMGSLDTMPEAAKQAALADRLVITKTDISEAAAVEALQARLHAMNPYALISRAVDGVLDPELLREITPASVKVMTEDPNRWLTGSGGAGPEEATEEGGSYLGQRLPGRTGAHDAAIHSFCLWFDAPFTWDTLTASLQVLTALRGPDLLRVKGIVNVAGEVGPVVIHGVQHIFHPPLKLERWHGEDRRSRIVFIVRNIPRTTVEGLFGAVGMLGEPEPRTS
jgi:G3E family GTPase